jgi:hypothetical protein
MPAPMKGQGCHHHGNELQQRRDLGKRFDLHDHLDKCSGLQTVALGPANKACFRPIFRATKMSLRPQIIGYRFTPRPEVASFSPPNASGERRAKLASVLAVSSTALLSVVWRECYFCYFYIRFAPTMMKAIVHGSPLLFCHRCRVPFCTRQSPALK